MTEEHEMTQQVGRAIEEIGKVLQRETPLSLNDLTTVQITLSHSMKSLNDIRELIINEAE